MDIRYIQVLLGHEKLSTTQKYTHFHASDLRDIVLRHHPRVLRTASWVERSREVDE
jgi:site-specific recombinase XerD